MSVNKDAFINGFKTKVIAPAGYGKTHFIAECIKYTEDNKLGKQLILTHTHAGIASIKEKLSKLGVKSSSYNIETICGYAQKYVFAFIDNSIIPEQKDAKFFYDFIINQVIELFSKNSIRNIIIDTYSGIFVDEYQDCTALQHEMIMNLKEIIPIHILGDPMQGIFDFKDNILVDFNTDLRDFEGSCGELDIPWRWQSDGNNLNLGAELGQIRDCLETKNNINLLACRNAIVNKVRGNVYDDSEYRDKVNDLLNDSTYNSVLIIAHGQIDERKVLRMSFGAFRNIQLLEAIDDNDFYSFANKFDDLIKNNSRKFLKFKIILEKLFGISDIKKWFNDDGLIAKRKDVDKQKSSELFPFVKNLIGNIVTYDDLYRLMYKLKNTLKLRCWRADLLNSIIKSLEESALTGCSVTDAMYNHKNNIRRMGRKIYGRCIGTTLLTKGLEFDHVIILDTQLFKNKKDFYVSVTRACKKLTIFTTNTTLSFDD